MLGYITFNYHDVNDRRADITCTPGRAIVAHRKLRAIWSVRAQSHDLFRIPFGDHPLYLERYGEY